MTARTIKQTSNYMNVQSRASLLVYYIYCEIVKLLRLPVFIIPSLLFPVMFFAMFGLPNIRYTFQGVPAGPYLLVSYGGYSTMFVALVSFGAAVASERGLSWNKLLRVTPLNPLVYFTAKIVMAIFIGLLSLIVLFVFGALVGKVSMNLLTWGELTGLLVIGMIPFIALGLLLGYVAGPNSAGAIASMAFVPLAFASGLLLPLQFLPDFVRTIAPYLPTYHVGQLGWIVLGAGDGIALWIHLLWLAGYTIVFLALAMVAYRRDEGKNFG